MRLMRARLMRKTTVHYSIQNILNAIDFDINILQIITNYSTGPVVVCSLANCENKILFNNQFERERKKDCNGNHIYAYKDKMVCFKCSSTPSILIKYNLKLTNCIRCWGYKRKELHIYTRSSYGKYYCNLHQDCHNCGKM
eukprot:521705_1